MAKLEIYECDKCHSRDGIKTITAIVGSQYNGVETENIEERIDLCPSCMKVAINNFLRSINVEDRKEWFNRQRKYK